MSDGSGQFPDPAGKLGELSQRYSHRSCAGSKPMLAIHSETRRAYWRVIILCREPRRPANKNSPAFLLAALK
jgi:hypothetical protein